MWTLLTKLNKNLLLAIPTMMLLGFAFGAMCDAGFLKALIIPFTFLMVYPMMVTLKLKKVLEGGDVKAQLLTQLINFAVVPFIAYGLGRFFFRRSAIYGPGTVVGGPGADQRHDHLLGRFCQG